MTIVDGPLTMMHANFTPHPPSAAVSNTTSPVTEVITCYFSAENDSFEENVNKLIPIIKEKAKGFKAASGGWVIEDVEHESIGSGKKGKAFVAVIGYVPSRRRFVDTILTPESSRWESVEAHMKFRETQTFKDNIHLLRDGPTALEVHHTAFTEK
jgi:hypothetical protein